MYQYLILNISRHHIHLCLFFLKTGSAQHSHPEHQLSEMQPLRHKLWAVQPDGRKPDGKDEPCMVLELQEEHKGKVHQDVPEKHDVSKRMREIFPIRPWLSKKEQKKSNSRPFRKIFFSQKFESPLPTSWIQFFISFQAEQYNCLLYIKLSNQCKVVCLMSK